MSPSKVTIKISKIKNSENQKTTAAGPSDFILISFSGILHIPVSLVLLDHNWPPIQVECDSKELIDIINGAAEREIYREIITNDIKMLGNSMKIATFKHIPRSGNNAAHIIARSPVFYCFSDFPESLNLCLSNDVT